MVQIDERAFAIGRRLPVLQAVVGSARPALAARLNRVQAKGNDAFLRSRQKEWRSWQTMLDEKADPTRSKDRIHPQALAHSASPRRAAAGSGPTGKAHGQAANFAAR